MNRVLALQQKMLKYPFGKVIFSKAVARMAPYFMTIDPRIEELRANYLKVSMRKKKSVQNHLGTVHAIAVCNLCEFAAGICMEASIPKHRRWIPAGMTVAYVKKAKTDLTAICDLSHINWETTEEVVCEISVRDANNEEVVKADIRMKVGDKKKRG